MERQVNDAMVDKVISLQDAVFSAGRGQPRYEAQVNFRAYAEEFAYELALDLRALRAAVREHLDLCHKMEIDKAALRALAGEEGADERS